MTDSRWVPRWVEQVDAPVWVVGPRHTIRYMNPQAEALLGISAADAIGKKCYEIVGAHSHSGGRLCGPHCTLLQLARKKFPIPPRTLRRLRGSASHWIRLFPIAVEEPRTRRPVLVHLAHRMGFEVRSENYLAKVASRTPPLSEPSRPSRLTAREREVLRLLTDDETLQSIALQLHVSHATVRNHVQHIVVKMGAHSTLEAVVRFLFAEEEYERPRRADR